MHMISVVDQNDYEISIKNPWILANEHSRRSSKLLDDHKSRKDLIPDCGSDFATNLNLGSPVQQNKVDDSHNIIIARVSGKRPNSAGNRAFNPEQKHEELYPNLLSSTVGISRKGVKMNLANMMFSKPEVESSVGHYDSRASIAKSNKQSIAYNPKSKAIILIQKYLRGYLARFKIAKEKELYDFLKEKIKLEDEHSENIGEPLKLSDLSIVPAKDNRGKTIGKDKKNARNNYNEMMYDFSMSKIEHTIEIDQTVRNYTIDDRDIDNKDMNLYIQESPLPKNMHEDEVSIISSRIETNRKFNQNITIDGLNSNRMNTQNNESLRILESLKRKPQTNMIYIESKNKKYPKDYEGNNTVYKNDDIEFVQPSISKYTQNSKVLPPPDWRKSLTHIKKTQSEKKNSIKGKSKESIDAILSTHRQKAQKDLIQENTFKKKRPWSAETNQNKGKQLDIAKIQASLRLLKKSITKSAVSSKDALENSDNLLDSNKIQITQNTISEINLLKRQNEKGKLFKRNSKRATSDFNTNNQTKILKDIMHTPKEIIGRGKESPHVPKFRRMFGSEKIVKQHSKRNYNEILTDSIITENNDNKVVQEVIEPSDVEKSIFDRSTFEDFSYKKFKEIFKNQIKMCQNISTEVYEIGQKKLKKITDLLTEKKISNNSFELKKRGIEKWMSIKKKAIKEKKKNFIQILGSIHRETSELQNLRKVIQSPDDSKANTKNIPSIILDTSLNSVGISKIEASDYNYEKHVTPIREIDNSSKSRIIDPQCQGNSNYSLLNSAAKVWQPSHRGHENNMSINSSKWIKALPDKDKHMYSIVPFEYKVKATADKNDQFVRETQFKIDNNKTQNKEIIVEKSVTDLQDLQKQNLSYRKDLFQSKHFDLEDKANVWDYLNISNDSQNNADEWIEELKVASKEIEFTRDIRHNKSDNQISASKQKQPKDYAEVKKEISYDSPHKSETDEEWNFKLPSIKSSSGHDNFRNSNSDHNILEEKKERENESVSIELLEKSPEMTVFISEKELSPHDPFWSDHNSHKKSRIEQLRDITNQMYREDNDDDELAINTSAKIIEAKKLLEDLQNDENNPILWSSASIAPNDKLMKQFEFMKEPKFDAINAIKNQTDFQKPTKRKLSEQETIEAENYVDMIYLSIVNEALASLFPLRVDVIRLRADDSRVVEEHNRTFSSESEEESNSNYIDQESSISNQNDEQYIIKTNSEDVIKYMNEIIYQVKSSWMEEVQLNLGRPIYKNPLGYLRDLQGFNYDISDYPVQDQQQVIPTHIYINKERATKSRKSAELESMRAENLKNGLDMNAGLINHDMFELLWEFDHIHHKAIFDAINQAFDYYRPYGLRWAPFPWSKNKRELTFKNNKSSEIDKVVDKVVKEVEEWAKTFGGTLQNSELFQGRKGNIDDNTLEQIRDNRLGLVLEPEIEENEIYWVDYENEETQIKLELSDVVTEAILEETVLLLKSLGDRF